MRTRTQTETTYHSTRSIALLARLQTRRGGKCEADMNSGLSGSGSRAWPVVWQRRPQRRQLSKAILSSATTNRTTERRRRSPDPEGMTSSVPSSLRKSTWKTGSVCTVSSIKCRWDVHVFIHVCTPRLSIVAECLPEAPATSAPTLPVGRRAPCRVSVARPLTQELHTSVRI